ncbi:hypothetical protein [Clostridium sp. ATCC 25772]|uniref:hypothetical protein n=1 Tax=Clostridium sp. ATCC 25772 TaxID=1676991 RepID=UPI0007830738|nr:hypothetical protein [Clostridium sp. ATCC 25772]
MKNNDEKNNSIVQNELKNKLLNCSNSIEFEKVIKQMYFKNMNVQKYITTTVYRILILNKHDYKGYERIAKHYGVYYQNQAKYIKQSKKKKSKCTGDSRCTIISDIKKFDTFKNIIR